ncbi:hypothetical protein COCVIDRAFT_101499 [Bipolaris victoriae FI3]|uniref:Effector 5 n=1 Tax=Bipolaris victoriae (strain FI3) TaxID=930091 RepID=W7EHA6_BIPV3|nr:hypothetical protein COCVIDRAFT_101499 [Bipolaris victoriae FI3]
MRYSSALVLSTIVVGQATAANLHNRHASFHARRQAEAKRSVDTSNVDWSKVAYQLGDVDWDKVFATPSPKPAEPVAEAKQVEAAAAPTYPSSSAPAEEKKPSPTPTPTPTSTPTPSPSSAPADDKKDPIGDLLDNVGDSINDIVGDVLNGLQSMITSIGAKTGKNPKSNQNGIWLGKDSKWRTQFTNDNNKDAILFCWRSNDFKNMCINEMQPEISVGLKSGESVDISFEENASAACAPVFPDTKLAMFGGVDNTWFEVTFGPTGAFDVSRNINMNGSNISAKGSKCTSDMNTCVFKCKNGMNTCEKGTDYDLFNCDSGNGGGGGYDPIMAGTGGGCSMGQNGEVIKVVLS